MMLLQSNFFPGGLGVWIWMLGKRPGVKLWTLLWCCLSPNRYTYMQNSPLHKRFNFHPGRARSKKWTAQIQKCISIYFKNVFGKLNYSYLRTWRTRPWAQRRLWTAGGWPCSAWIPFRRRVFSLSLVCFPSFGFGRGASSVSPKQKKSFPICTPTNSGGKRKPKIVSPQTSVRSSLWVGGGGRHTKKSYLAHWLNPPQSFPSPLF